MQLTLLMQLLHLFKDALCPRCPASAALPDPRRHDIVEAVLVGSQIMSTVLIQALHAPQDTFGPFGIRQVAAPQANDGTETVSADPVSQCYSRVRAILAFSP